MYTGNDKDLLDESIDVVFDRGTTILSLFKDNLLRRRLISQPLQKQEQLLEDPIISRIWIWWISKNPFYLRGICLHSFLQFIKTFQLPREVSYDIELNIFPTDVTNHYSGYPITRWSILIPFFNRVVWYYDQNLQPSDNHSAGHPKKWKKSVFLILKLVAKKEYTQD